MNRWPIAFILLGLIAAGLAYDQVVEISPAESSVSGTETVVTPAVGDPARLDGAWFCPVGSSDVGGFADHTVNISNFGEEPAVANLSILTADGPGPARRIDLAPFSTERVKLSDTQVVDVAAAVVEVTGGKGAVGHTVTTAEGVAEGPCATNASNTWYFAAGRTTRDSTQYLALMNPFPETAVFDVEFQAATRSREPGPLQGAFVRARSVRIIEVGEFVAPEEALATKITTARGRLVVERLQLLDGELGSSGAALQLGVPSPAQSWIFTAGRVHEGGDDLLTIFNPFEVSEVVPTTTDGDDTEEEVESVVDEQEGFTTVAVELWPTNPADLSNFSVVTIEREIRPGTFATIDLRAQAERFEFPLPYELGVNVTSLEGLPIVAERWQFAERLLVDGVDPVPPPVEPEPEPEEVEADPDNPETADGEGADAGADEGGGAALLELQPPEPVDSGLPQPLPTAGLSTTRGNELFSTRWLIPWVTVVDDSTLISVAAIEEAAVEVLVVNGGQLEGPTRATVSAGGRAIIPLASNSGGAAVEIRASRPVSVESVVVLPDESLDVVPAIPTVDS